MYKSQDLRDVTSQFRRRLALFFMALAVMLVPLAYSLTVRMQWLTVTVSSVVGCCAIFVCGVWLSPVAAYRRHLRGVLSGRTREVTGVFRGFEGAVTVRDGVRFWPLTLNVGDMTQPKDDRLLYWDANIPLPNWQPGEGLWTASFDKAITDWKRA